MGYLIQWGNYLQWDSRCSGVSPQVDGWLYDRSLFLFYGTIQWSIYHNTTQRNKQHNWRSTTQHKTSRIQSLNAAQHNSKPLNNTNTTQHQTNTTITAIHKDIIIIPSQRHISRNLPRKVASFYDIIPYCIIHDSIGTYNISSRK